VTRIGESHVTFYDADFYEAQREGSLTSAREVIPCVLKYVRPRSVVDVGCGVGTWLSVFKQHGVADILGIDGDYVDEKLLHISPSEFKSHDLTTPFSVDRYFDLAMSLEVAEHLPAEAADDFVGCLAKLAPVVLFSAAIPQQGGVNHINEQWPGFWAALFAVRDYVLVDCLREDLWNMEEIKPHYAQNVLFFVDRSRLEFYPALRAAYEERCTAPRALVHPRIFEHRISQLTAEKELRPPNFGLREVLKATPSIAAFALRSELKRLLMPLLRRLGFPEGSVRSRLRRFRR
jgi:SAM-dependent methyltransferase